MSLTANRSVRRGWGCDRDKWKEWAAKDKESDGGKFSVRKTEKTHIIQTYRGFAWVSAPSLCLCGERQRCKTKRAERACVCKWIPSFIAALYRTPNYKSWRSYSCLETLLQSRVSGKSSCNAIAYCKWGEWWKVMNEAGGYNLIRWHLTKWVSPSQPLASRLRCTEHYSRRNKPIHLGLPASGIRFPLEWPLSKT